MNKKLAPELRARLRSAGDDRSMVPPFERKAKSDSARVGIIVEFNGNIEDLTAIGFEKHTLVQHPTKGYKIATGLISVDRIEDLAAIEHVVEVEGPRRMHPELNYSLPEIHAPAVHLGTPPRKGDGIVIGVIDDGFDWRHGTFIKKEDGTSRVLALWDQIGKAKPGETPGPGQKGVIYTRDQINLALQGKTTVDTDQKASAHGTHVAGIAAGNGEPATCCHGRRTYIGVAPKADLIVVCIGEYIEGDIGKNQLLVDALSYISTGSQPLNNAPKVVNISLGDNFGPHDGTTLLERSIDALVETGEILGIPFIVVKSAGNEGNALHHVTEDVPATDNLNIEFIIGEKETSIDLDLWYDRASILHLTVTDPSGISHIIHHGINLPPSKIGSTSTLTVDTTINGAFDRDNNFRIQLHDPQGLARPKPWTLNLANPNAGLALFHCWIEHGTKCWFLPPVNPSDDKIRASSDTTLTIPGTSSQVIAVANYKSRRNCCDCCDCWRPAGIHPSSSRGPVAKETIPNQKPEIAAPGYLITSAKADAVNCCHDLCCTLYTNTNPKGEEFTGTSMAAPHVTGAIALLLEENPRLTRADIVRHLQAAARDRPASGWDPNWGGGKLDVEAAIKAVRSGARGGGNPLLHPQIISDPSLNNRTYDPRQLHFTPGTELTRGSVKDSDHLPQAFPSWFQVVREKLKALPEGEHIAAALSRHFSEVRRLINTNRRVATMWHRAHGPCLLRRFLDGSLDANALAPSDSNTAAQYLNRCFDLLTRYGSPLLRDSMEKYRSLLIALLAIPICTPSNSTMSEGV